MRPVFLTLALVCSLSWASGSCEARPIVIVLRDAATVSGSQVRIGDIADLQECEQEERERIARLDLAELPLSSQPIHVTQQQIGFRLQLAGLDAGSYRLQGSSCVRVSRPKSEGLEAKIAAVARQSLEQKLSGQTEDYRIEQAQAVVLPPLSADSSDIHLEAEVRSQIIPPCRVAVDVGIYVRGARRNSVLVYLDVKKLQPVPVAIRHIESGETFSADNVRLERIAVANPQNIAVSSAGLMGRRARRPMSAGHPIEPEDLEPDTQVAAVVRANDLVHLIATVGPMQVKTRGQAMQDGRIGQLIQVRNMDSKNVVTGRVVDRSTVEVEY
jgi:flagella basal body P-ring formation protein FlgA